MGNRGCIHNEAGEITKPFSTISWVTCLLNPRNDRAKSAEHCTQLYTPLFFLDEATALAAGHRPCARCRQKEFHNFKTLWLQANPHYLLGPQPFITQIDRIIHGQRIDHSGQKITYHDKIGNLPIGTFITLNDNHNLYYLVWEDGLFEWSPEGYKHLIPCPFEHTIVRILTPRSIVNTLTEGYTPIVRLTPQG